MASKMNVVEDADHDEQVRKHNTVLQFMRDRDIDGARSVGLTKWDCKYIDEDPFFLAQRIIREGGYEFSDFFSELGFSISREFKGTKAITLLQYMAKYGEHGMMRGSIFHGAKYKKLHHNCEKWLALPIPLRHIDYTAPKDRMLKATFRNRDIVTGRRYVYHLLEEIGLPVKKLCSINDYATGKFR
jgi:hypothetical protein